MTNLTPAGPNGTQGITPPSGTISPDVFSLLRSPQLLVGTEPLRPGMVQIIDLTRMGFPGLLYWRVMLNDNRGGYRQIGKFSEVHNMRSEGSAICDRPGVLRNSYMVNTAATPDPVTAGSFDRIFAVDFAGTMVVMPYQANVAADMRLYKETSATSPLITTVAGFVSTGTAAFPSSIRRWMINDTPYLWISWIGLSGGNNLQILSDLANPPTSSTVPVGNVSVWDTWQTGIDGNAVLIYRNNAAGSGEIVAIRTDIAAGSATVSAPRSTVRPGGYFVGESSWQGSPRVYLVQPTETSQLTGQVMQFNAAAHTAGHDRGQLLSMDERGYLPTNVNLPLRFVTFVTTVGAGMVVCDRGTHYFCSPGRIERMGFFDDRAANSDRTPICCGHYEKDGRFGIEVNNIAAVGTSSTAVTTREVLEWDFDLWAPKPMTKPETLSTTGILSVGGPRMPWSTNTQTMQTYVNGDANWHYQFEPALGVNGLNLAHTSGSAGATGPEYTDSDSITWPLMELDGLEGMPKILAAAGGVLTGNIARGSVTAGATGARMLVEELSSGLTGTIATRASAALFDDSGQARKMQRHPFENNDSWFYLMQPRLTLQRASAGTDNTRFTLNGFGTGIILEGFAKPDNVWAQTGFKGLTDRAKAWG